MTINLPNSWQCTSLGELGRVVGGGTPSTIIQEFWNGGIPWIVPSEVTKHADLYIEKTERTISHAGLQTSATSLLPIGTVMMTSRATIGEVVINSVPMATNQGFINVICNPQVIVNDFLALWIKHNKQVFIDRAHGVTFKEITKSNFRKIPIMLPPVPEQRAIAQVLRAAQDAKAARVREVTLERERKAALMQYLFTRGIQNEPLKQTEIGEIPASWQVIALSSVMHEPVQNGAFIKNPIVGSGVPYVNVYDIYQDAIIDTSKVQRLSVSDAVIANYALKPNDILFVRSSLKATGIGQCCLVQDLKEPSIFDCHLIKFSPDISKVHPLYLTSYFLSEIGRRDLIARSTTTTMTTINQRTLLETTFPLPDMSVQYIIASVLRTCDTKIAALNREIILCDELFRALLDQLMTGELRATALIEPAEVPNV